MRSVTHVGISSIFGQTADVSNIGLEIQPVNQTERTKKSNVMVQQDTAGVSMQTLEKKFKAQRKDLVREKLRVVSSFILSLFHSLIW